VEWYILLSVFGYIVLEHFVRRLFRVQLVVVLRRLALLQPNEEVRVLVLNKPHSASSVTPNALDHFCSSHEGLRDPEIRLELDVVFSNSEFLRLEQHVLRDLRSLKFAELTLRDGVLDGSAANEGAHIPKLEWRVLVKGQERKGYWVIVRMVYLIKFAELTLRN
jgi:hypothetical protein